MTKKRGNREKLEPHEVRQMLSNDVHAVLSACLHFFEEEQELIDHTFNVDAIMSGRPHGRVVTERHKAAPRKPYVTYNRPEAPHVYATSRRGNFIPRSV